MRTIRALHMAAATLVAGTAIASGASAARASDTPDSLSAGGAQLSHVGRWITDQKGRVHVLHGLDMVNKLATSGYAPDGVGFGANDAAFLRKNGFNVVRLGIIWKALEPRPGAFNVAYLNRIYKTYRVLHQRGIAVLLDFHQDLYNERFQGEGAPDWAVLGRAAAETPSPLAGFPANYIVQDAVNQAYDAFWANTLVPGTNRGVQDLYAGAWAYVARRFAGKSGIVGYNLYNEPWEGTLGQRGVVDHCATTPASCGVQHFESTTLTTFYRRVVKAIRKVDPRTVVYQAPTLVFDFGFRSGLGKLDGHSGFAFNAYCAQATGLDAVIPFLQHKPCSYSANLSFKNAEAVSRRSGEALFMTEFGASDNISTFTPYLDIAQDNLISWAEWAYCDCGDPTTTGTANAEALVVDPRKAPTGSNVNTKKLRTLAVPYPTVVSGTPAISTWNAARRTYHLTYTDKPVKGGHSFPAGSITELATPATQYPSGYRLSVTGARVLSKANAPVVQLALCARASSVSVAIKPGRGPTTVSSCRRRRLRQ